MGFFKRLIFICLFALLYCSSASGVLADQLTIDIPSVDVSVTKDADGYAKFEFSDPERGSVQFISKTGEPAIPYLILPALLPPGADLSTLEVEIKREAVTSEAVQSQEEWDVRKIPSPSAWDGQEVITLDETAIDDPYAVSARFPYNLLDNISTGNLWEWQVADIPIALYQYNPISKQLYRINASQAVLTFEHKSARSARIVSSGSFNKERVRKLVVNFDDIAPEYRSSKARSSSSEQKSGYVIITSNSVISACTETINAFVRHKGSRGFAVHVMPEAIWGGGKGDTAAENIRNWLKDNYIRLNIEYVLLIGNPDPLNGDVPMKMLYPRNNAASHTQYKDSPSDFYYADLTGDWDLDKDGKYGEWDDDFGDGGVDRNFEIIVGRIPYYGNPDDLDSILEKTIVYQTETNQEWRKNVLLPMEPSDEYTPGYHLGEEIKGIAASEGWTCHRVYEEDYGVSPEKTPCDVNNVTNTWNSEPFGAVFWWTHGWYTSASDIMDIDHADMLDNTHPVFTFQCSCENSHPEATDNLSYSLLRNGSIASLGATRVSWYYPGQTDFVGRSSNSGMTYEYAKRLITNETKSGGYALHDMKQTLTPASSATWMNFTGFCLYGDPEVAMMNEVVADNPPDVSDIPDQTTKMDTEVTIPFTVSDDMTAASALLVSGSSSDTGIVPDDGIVFGGSDEERTITITPVANKFGSATITISVNDGKNSTSASFAFTAEEQLEWQWVNPSPTQGSLNGIWGNSKDDVFAVGQNGVIIHYDGSELTPMKNESSYHLRGIWGNSHNNMLAVGAGGIILHYDGNGEKKWTEMNSGVYATLHGIWGNSSDSIFAVGADGVILHFNGTIWTEMESGTSTYLSDVWGSSDNDVFAVGYDNSEGGTILHYDGNTWSETKMPSVKLKAVWGFSAEDVFAASWEGKILHYDGDQWEETAQPTDNFRAIWGMTSDDVFAAGGSGKIFHHDGSSWSEMPNPLTGHGNSHFSGIWGSSAQDVFAVTSSGRFLYYDGNTWTDKVSGTIAQLHGVWADSDTDVFAVGYTVGGNGTVQHYNGDEWTEIKDSSHYLFDVWGSSGTDVFVACSSGSVLHYNGNEWTDERITEGSVHFNGIWGRSSSDVFAVGTEGKTFHYDGNSWSEMTSNTSETLNAVWGTSDTDDVFAAGSDGTILRYDGNAWAPMASGTSYSLAGIWGTSGDNVFAVGGTAYTLGVVLHYDGSTWTDITDPYHTNSYYESIWGSSENNIFAVRTYDTILSYNGSDWTEIEQLGDADLLYDIWGSSGNIFAVGAFGKILHYSPPTDHPVLLVTPAYQSVSASEGTTTFDISNSGTGTFSWTATANDSWLSVSPASGMNSGTLTVTYQTNAGNARTGTVTVFAEGAENSPKTIEVRQSEKQARHFTPVWTGNPYNRMNLWVVGAGIDGEPLSAGDEIAVFDGNKCVGAEIVDSEISYENELIVTSSQDDGSGNGFTPGNEISFRFWDASEGIEKTGVTAYFKDFTTGDPIAQPTFSSKEDYGLILETGDMQQQSIDLRDGWNIMSFYVVPENTGMLDLVQPLIDENCLVKVIGQDGGTVIKVFGKWKNTIGSYNPEEGYEIKLSCDTQLDVQGASAQSQQSNMYVSTSQHITLRQGWNIIGYPFDFQQNAMDAVQPLIDSGTLVKVIDETGGTIIKVFGKWKNTIDNNSGYFKPGEGYQIKVSADSSLMFDKPDSLRSASHQGKTEKREGEHFIPIWTSEYEPMELWVAGIESLGLEGSDEIGVFDGDVCVGVSTISDLAGEISFDTPLRIITSKDDGTDNGFTEGNELFFKFWDSDKGIETEAEPDFMDMDGNPIDPPVFKGKESYGVTLAVESDCANIHGDLNCDTVIDLRDAILVLKLSAGINQYVNIGADVNDDKKIGIDEAVFILRKITGLIPVKTYTVKFTSELEAVGVVEGTQNQTVEEGKDCTEVEAVPVRTGCAFDHWEGLDNPDQQNENPLTVSNVTEDMEIKAVFTCISLK